MLGVTHAEWSSSLQFRRLQKEVFMYSIEGGLHDEPQAFCKLTSLFLKGLQREEGSAWHKGRCRISPAAKLPQQRAYCRLCSGPHAPHQIQHLGPQRWARCQPPVGLHLLFRAAEQPRERPGWPALLKLQTAHTVWRYGHLQACSEYRIAAMGWVLIGGFKMVSSGL